MKNKIFLTPIIFIGVIFLILGISWIVVDEPWLLDRVANEEKLNMTFDQLFNEEINDSLPSYLKQIYRFFGLWACIIGIFIVSFARLKFIEIKAFAKSLLICMAILVISSQIFGYLLIPNSPFIYL